MISSEVTLQNSKECIGQDTATIKGSQTATRLLSHTGEDKGSRK
jgi:hypothetical protein